MSLYAASCVPVRNVTRRRTSVAAATASRTQGALGRASPPARATVLADFQSAHIGRLECGRRLVDHDGAPVSARSSARLSAASQSVTAVSRKWQGKLEGSLLRDTIAFSLNEFDATGSSRMSISYRPQSRSLFFYCRRKHRKISTVAVLLGSCTRGPPRTHFPTLGKRLQIRHPMDKMLENDKFRLEVIE